MDPVTTTATIIVVPSSATAHYSVSTSADVMVTITQATPDATTMTIPAATVTVTITANDGTVDSTPMMLSVPFAARTYDPGDVMDPVVAVVRLQVHNLQRLMSVSPLRKQISRLMVLLLRLRQRGQ